VTYTYNFQSLDPIKLLKQYGFIIENNVFASLGMTVSGALDMLTHTKKMICDEISCSD
jgi:hypothetical protein